MKGGVLAVGWLDDQFEAAWVDARGGVRTWKCPTPVVDVNRLHDAVREARRQAGGRLRRTAWLVDHRNLLYHVQETPPVRGRWIAPLIDQVVGESKFFDEEAIWAKLAIPGSETRYRWLLALMPRSLWVEIEAVCAGNELLLIGLHPAAAFLGAVLPRVSTGADEAVLLVGDFGNSHGLLVGRGDGQVLFARSIARSGREQEGRLEQEINRTLHFFQQRFGSRIRRLVAVGSACYSCLSGHRIRDDLRVEQLEDGFGSAGHLGGLLEHLGRVQLDFSLGRRRQPAWVGRSLALGMILLLVLSASTAVLVREEARVRRVEFERAKRETKATTIISNTRRMLGREAARLRAFVAFIGTQDRPSFPSAFCRYLCATVPTSLRLTTCSMEKTTNSWSIGLEGRSREQGSGFITALAEFESAMESSSFRFSITDSTQRQSLSEMGSKSIAEPRTLPGGASLDSAERTFFVRGTIR